MIGIDFGTKRSRMAVMQDGVINTKLINIDNFVSFNGAERVIGYEAKELLLSNPTNTVFDSKRLIGRKFNENPVIDNTAWPFQVNNNNGQPEIAVKFDGEMLTFHPEEIVAIILKNMKDTAELHLKRQILEAVVTVPTSYNNMQRQAMLDACEIAGFRVNRIINNTSAVALAYTFQHRDIKAKNVMIFHLGGGSFDVSILTIRSGNLYVKATEGDSHLGGEDFDMMMVEHFVEDFIQKHGIDLRNDRLAILRLRLASEQAKESLSNSLETEFTIERLHDLIDYQIRITRKKFEELNEGYFQSIKTHVVNCLRASKFKKEDIHEIVMVGGSTRIPRVQHLVRELFDGIELNEQMNYDECFVKGAAVQAAILSHDIKYMSLDDVASMRLGVTFQDGLQMNVIDRNTRIPDDFIKIRFIVGASFRVYEGEVQNICLGHFTLFGVPLNHIRIKMIFFINANGILVVVEEKFDPNVNVGIVVNNDRLSKDDIKSLMARENIFRYRQKEERMLARNALEDYVLKNISIISEDDRIEIFNLLCSSLLAPRQKYVDFLQELEAVYNPIMNQGGLADPGEA